MEVGHCVQTEGLDLAELLSRVEGDHELLRDILDIFMEEFPRSYRILTAALASNDLWQVQVSAHTLKGMFSSLSFVQASASARRIEQMARSLQREGLEEEMACMKQTAHVAQASLQKVCHECLL